MAEFALDEDRIAIREMARGFADEKLARMPSPGTRRNTFPLTSFARRRRSAWPRSMCARTSGDRVEASDAVLIFEALATGCPTVAAYHLDPQHVRLDDRRIRQRGAAAEVSAAIGRHGAASELLPHRARDGIDAAALRTRAEREGEFYVLTARSNSYLGPATRTTSMS